MNLEFGGVAQIIKTRSPLQSDPHFLKLSWAQLSQNLIYRIFIDMIGSDLIRDLNIRRTFMVVDKVKDYPIESMKISVKCEIEDCDYKDMTKSQYKEMIKEFVMILKETFKNRMDRIFQIGVSPEYRIDSKWGTSIFNFRFIILGYGLKEFENRILKESSRISNVVGGDTSVTTKIMSDREDLFFELYPTTMLDEVLNLMMNMDIQTILPEELLQIMFEPINLKNPSDFVSYYLK
jgi:hypothetical protein